VRGYFPGQRGGENKPANQNYDFSHNNVISMDDLFYIAQDWLSTGQEY
jgi:hypothetical protein